MKVGDEELKNKIDEELIVTNEDTLKMLDDILEKRDSEWWNGIFRIQNKENSRKLF